MVLKESLARLDEVVIYQQGRVQLIRRSRIGLLALDLIRVAQVVDLGYPVFAVGDIR